MSYDLNDLQINVNWPAAGRPGASPGDPIVAAAADTARDLLRLQENAGAAGLDQHSDPTPSLWVAGHAS